MTALTESLTTLLSEHCEFQSGFQLDRFVIAGAGHPWAQYQQALRTLAAQFDALKTEQINLDLALLELEEAEAGPDPSAEEPESPFSARRRELNARAARLKIETMERRMRDRVREFGHVLQRASALHERFAGRSDAEKAELEHEAWVYRLQRQVAVEMMTQGGISAETFDSVLLLPAEDRDAILDAVRPDDSLHERLTNFLRRTSGEPLPGAEEEIAPALPGEEEIRRLACP